MDHKDVAREWERLCGIRKIPVPANGTIPVLKETDQKVRDAGIKWYPGSFPGDPDISKFVLGAARYKQHKSRVDHGMRMDAWNESERKRTTRSIKVLVEAIEKYWMMGPKKRKSTDTDSDDEEWHPKWARSSRR